MTAADARPRPGSLAAWLLASRPATLTAAVAPVAVGAACAHALGGFRLAPTLAALAGAVWIQIGTNFVNDVADFESGADTEERLGPTRAVQAGLLSPRQARLGLIVSFALATAFGAYLIAVGGWPILAVGVASLISGIAYTAGPFPLGYHGLGDVFVFWFFGPVAVCGTVWVNLLTVPELAIWASIPLGALATNILVVNNLRDRATDAVAGKRTLAVRFGRSAAIGQYLTLLAAAYLVPLILWIVDLASAWVLLPLATLLLAGRLARRLLRAEGRALNPLLVGSARLLVPFSALFAIGLAAG
ncbi:MAG: 1,4-dihydroxy-2-naphthoate polyprenyltransferase [Acidobacteriota bacterium]